MTEYTAKNTGAKPVYIQVRKPVVRRMMRKGRKHAWQFWKPKRVQYGTEESSTFSTIIELMPGESIVLDLKGLMLTKEFDVQDWRNAMATEVFKRLDPRPIVK